MSSEPLQLSVSGFMTEQAMHDNEMGRTTERTLRAMGVHQQLESFKKGSTAYCNKTSLPCVFPGSPLVMVIKNGE